MWMLSASVVATAVTTTIVTATTVTATIVTVESDNVKWRDLNCYWWIMEKREYERGNVVLSYSWSFAAVTAEGVRKKCIVFTFYKPNGGILIMWMDVSMSSMKRNHWITSNGWMPLTNARQLTIDVNECQGTRVHLAKWEWMCWCRATCKIWQSRDIDVFPWLSARELAIKACKPPCTQNELYSLSQIMCWGRWGKTCWKVGHK